MHNYTKAMNGRIFETRAFNNGKVKYKLNPSSRVFVRWIDEGFQAVREQVIDGSMYIVNDTGNKNTRETLTVLGILESFGILTFKSLGGTNSQIYLYINETKNMRMVKEKPEMYRNRLLEAIGERHEKSVQMLTYLFGNDFSSDEIWEHMENYFLGILPDELKAT